ncbi:MULTISPECIES: thiol reductant ABC exporter subunit CydD [unclassified Gemella]|uniref:thiol reductant ABC exporter subunit CydD n=1 Tax=unclassified Gemella TaxID=2624949 RepID=UPI0010730506|nr:MULTISPECIES: thiol reductant ABC exporter subunit CydD [unclassified Gemella]MBF0710125.1 thiol reductant ABC exporter subunit CydD [Gemella sp. GL1.1]MBF0746204.1 thiol reductant ABC exporter subunit CydD [Gemella sp. 19428wG2_WT2a]NYS27469.1 thiol reductant ABC exporter subunit CydD [Gemella sp. GL1]TFU60488.1 thiol reductant ABC exporter subunit CydD [Gemella sp. WT2a]
MSKYRKSKVSLPVKKSLYIILLFLSIVEAVCIILQTAFLAKTIVSLFESEYNIFNYVLLFFIGYFFRTVSLHLQQYFTEKEAEKLEISLREQLIYSYFKKGAEFTSKEGTGKLITLSIEGIAQVKNYFELNVSKKLRSVIIPILVVWFTFYTDKVSAFMISSFIPVIVIFMILLGVTARDMADRQYKKYRILSNNFVDTIRGIESLKFLGIAKNYLPIMEEKNSEYRKSTMLTLRYAFLNSFALDILTTLAIAFLAVRLGILLLAGDTNLLPALTVLLIAPEFFLPMKQAATDYHASLNGQVAYEEIINIINTQDKSKNNYEKICNFKKLELRNVSLIKEEKAVLDNISFTIKEGDRICIVGQSGSGKTSLISILSGISNNSSGDIKINEKNVGLKNSNWIEHISYISQFPYIFPASIRSNLEFYLDKPSSAEELDKVTELVGLDTYVKGLDKGYDTLIGEGGRELSGGQAQRIAIARALLSDRKVVILDEPTSHLDIETEFEIKEKLLALFKDRTVIIATHRLHWLNDMDYVLNIESGKVKYFEKLDNFREDNKYEDLKKSLVGERYE